MVGAAPRSGASCVGERPQATGAASSATWRSASTDSTRLATAPGRVIMPVTASEAEAPKEA